MELKILTLGLTFTFGILLGIGISVILLFIINKKEQVKTKLLEFRSDIYLNGDLDIDLLDEVRKNDIHHISFEALIIFDNLYNYAKRFYDFRVVFYEQNAAIFTVFCDKSQENVKINKKSHIICEKRYVAVRRRATEELLLRVCIHVNDYNLIQNADEVVFSYRDIREKESRLRLFKGSIKNTIRSKFFDS